MNLEQLRHAVFEANMELHHRGLVLDTFGNVSGINREEGMILIKPSGVTYENLSPASMVAVSLETGTVVDSDLRPSSDTPTHLELYDHFKCGGIVHMHSEYATALAQNRLPIRCMGTTHADYFRGDIPVSRSMTKEEVEKDYERNTGRVIVETFQNMDPMEIPGLLVANHGPFAWGRDPHEAVHHAVILEFLAKLENTMLSTRSNGRRPEQWLIDKHYFRKHGKGAYYGQRSKSNKT